MRTMPRQWPTPQAGSSNIWLATTYQSNATNPLAPAESDGNFHVHLWTSADGIGWQDICANGVYSDAVNGWSRDVALFYESSSGTFYGVYSVKPTAPVGALAHFECLSSTDLLSWTDVGSLGNLNTLLSDTSTSLFSGEFYTEGGNPYFLFPYKGSGTYTQGSIWETHPTNAAWTTWSAPSKITDGNAWGGEVCVDLYDPFIVKSGSTYYLFVVAADDVSGNLGMEYGTSASMLSGYTRVGVVGDWANYPSDFYESQNIIALADGTWRMYYEYLENDLSVHHSYYREAATPAGPWGAATEITNRPFNASGMTVIQLAGSTARSALKWTARSQHRRANRWF